MLESKPLLHYALQHILAQQSTQEISQRNSHAANTGVLGRTRIILSSVLGGVGD